MMANSFSDLSGVQDYDSSNEIFPYNEIYFHNLESQANIYCCSKLFSADEEKLLIATLRGNVSCIECEDDSKGSRKLCANAIYFTYIPGDAEIISMDTFTCATHTTPPRRFDTKVIAISLALVKITDGVKKYQFFLNIYKAMEPEKSTSLKDIARGCEHIELQFTPFQLTHASIYLDGKCKENVFLLSGNDQKIHFFKENEERQRFEEFPVEDFFPEFVSLPSNVMWMDTKNCKGDLRVSAVGCQNGFVKVSVVNYNSAILKSFTMDAAGLVSSVRLFPLKSKTSTLQMEETVSSPNEESYCIDQAVDSEDLCLLVTCTLKLSVIYSNVCSCGFKDMVVLPKSDHFDSITCSAIADLDLDGDNEIILGTYGQELLVYKSYRSSTKNDQVSSHFDLQWTKSFPKPLLAIQTVDLNRDGLQELIAVCLNGVHVLQYDVGKAAEKIIQKIMKEHLNSEININSKSPREIVDHMSHGEEKT